MKIEMPIMKHCSERLYYKLRQLCVFVCVTVNKMILIYLKQYLPLHSVELLHVQAVAHRSENKMTVGTMYVQTRHMSL